MLFQANFRYFKDCAKNKYVCCDEIILSILIKNEGENEKLIIKMQYKLNYAKTWLQIY